jgi:hypothetical protein
MEKFHGRWSIVIGLSLSNIGLGQNLPQPTYDGLYTSKQICMGMARRIKSLINLAATEGEGSPPSRDALGTWKSAQINPEDAPQDNPPEEVVLENDNAAFFALSGMSKGTFALGQALDEAMALYGTPSFGQALGKVCGATLGLISANKGAKLAASLPEPRVYKPEVFDSFDIELEQVKAQTYCY